MVTKIWQQVGHYSVGQTSRHLCLSEIQINKLYVSTLFSNKQSFRLFQKAGPARGFGYTVSLLFFINVFGIFFCQNVGMKYFSPEFLVL